VADEDRHASIIIRRRKKTQRRDTVSAADLSLPGAHLK